jgi:threonine/homoserine/homoserine lactone efflux protein
VIDDLLGPAIGIAASPFPVIPAILLLLTPRATANAASFLGGWAAGVLVATTAFVLLESVIELAEDTPTWVSWARVALGLALVVLGVRQWLSRREEQPAPAWMQSLESASPGSAARLGIFLSLANPKILLFCAAAGLGIGASSVTGVSAGVTVVLFALAASVSVALPLLAHLVLGDRATTPLRQANDWLSEHNATVMALVLLVIGALVLSKGVSGL